MPHVMSLINVPMSIGSMSHVDFKKGLCRPVEFKGQGPTGARSLRCFADVRNEPKLVPPGMVRNSTIERFRKLTCGYDLV